MWANENEEQILQSSRGATLGEFRMTLRRLSVPSTYQVPYPEVTGAKEEIERAPGDRATYEGLTGFMQQTTHII